MIEFFLFLLFTLAVMVFLIGVLVLTVRFFIARARKKTCSPAAIKVWAIMLACAAILNIGLITISQFAANTPRVIDDSGKEVAGSIAQLQEVTLNGRKQWISVRGRDKNAPVLLFLAGGPGGTQMAAVRHELADLEERFVVVNWDQPGSGKSYYAANIKSITVQTYIEDGHALTRYLKERFEKEKIFLIGESWGSALGIFLINEYPQDYYAFIGTGQMVDFAETERLDYLKAIEIAEQKGDTKLIKELRSYGEAPYNDDDMVWKSAKYLNYLSAYMASDPNIHNGGYNTIRDIFSSEYGLIDKINFFLGIINTFNHVYRQLYDIDLRKDYAKLDVPVYFFLGRHDINAPVELAEEYYEVLDAPEKEIIWFEHSGHSPWINERQKFIDEVVTCFTKNLTEE